MPLRALSLYRQLSDGLSDMIESGRLTEEEIPEDYEWLVVLLTKIVAVDPTQADEPTTTIEALRREHRASCKTLGCDGDPSDGEGWDGYCGICADRRSKKGL